MKLVTILLFSLASTALAASCGLDYDHSLKPFPPVGYTDVTRACVCDYGGIDCRWAWVGTNNRGGSEPVHEKTDSSVLEFFSNWGASQRRSRLLEAQAQEANARTALIQEQTRALEMQNAARRAELERQGLIPHVETRAEKADRQFAERIQQARARHPDFNAVIAGFNPTPTIRQAILKSHVPGELSYWMGQHPEECDRIAVLPPSAAAREIHKIEMRVRKSVPAQ